MTARATRYAVTPRLPDEALPSGVRRPHPAELRPLRAGAPTGRERAGYPPVLVGANGSGPEGAPYLELRRYEGGATLPPATMVPVAAQVGMATTVPVQPGEGATHQEKKEVGFFSKYKYPIIGCAILALIFGGYYFKRNKKKKAEAPNRAALNAAAAAADTVDREEMQKVRAALMRKMQNQQSEANQPEEPGAPFANAAPSGGAGPAPPAGAPAPAPPAGAPAPAPAPPAGVPAPSASGSASFAGAAPPARAKPLAVQSGTAQESARVAAQHAGRQSSASAPHPMPVSSAPGPPRATPVGPPASRLLSPDACLRLAKACATQTSKVEHFSEMPSSSPSGENSPSTNATVATASVGSLAALRPQDQSRQRNTAMGARESALASISALSTESNGGSENGTSGADRAEVVLPAPSEHQLSTDVPEQSARAASSEKETSATEAPSRTSQGRSHAASDGGGVPLSHQRNRAAATPLQRASHSRWTGEGVSAPVVPPVTMPSAEPPSAAVPSVVAVPSVAPPLQSSEPLPDSSPDVEDPKALEASDEDVLTLAEAIEE